jgi:two-component system cell cycle response regulator DivK
MDLRLPGSDSYAVTRALKGGEPTQQSLVIALTVFAMEGDREKAIQAGCDGYITKPIETRSFPAAVRQFLRTRSEEGEWGDGDKHENPSRGR